MDNGELERVKAGVDSLRSRSSALSPAQQHKLTHLKARVLYRKGKTAELIGLAESMELEEKQPGDADNPHLEAIRHMAEQAREQRTRRNQPPVTAPQPQPQSQPQSTSTDSTATQNQKREN